MSTNTQHAAIKSRTLIALIIASFALGGCATFSKDGGFGAVQDTAKKYIKQEVVWPKTQGENIKSQYLFDLVIAVIARIKHRKLWIRQATRLYQI